jgi:ribose transport system permease protein
MDDVVRDGDPGLDPRPAVGVRRIAAGAGGVGRLITSQQDAPLAIVLIAMIGLVSVFHPAYLSQASLINLSLYAAWFGTMAFGMVFLLSMGEIDLSVGAMFGLSIVVAARLMEAGLTPWLAVVITLGVGAALGAINGVISNLLQISTLIVTLGTLSAYTALGLILANDGTITDLPVNNSFFKNYGGGISIIPTADIVCVLALFACHILYKHTRFGFKVRAIGSNREAARLAGISIARTRLLALILQGFLCALIGVTVLAYIEAADPNAGTGYELSVIAAAIIGGTALSGGIGTVIGALVGSLIISVITTGLVEFGFSSDWGNFATGVVIIAAVTLDRWIKGRRLHVAEGAARRTLRAAIGEPDKPSTPKLPDEPS